MTACQSLRFTVMTLGMTLLYGADPRPSCLTRNVQTEIRELLVEGVVPPQLRLQSGDAVPLAADVRAMIENGTLQIRLRVEYNQDYRTLRTVQYVAVAADPLPMREAPSVKSGSVLQMVESSVDHLAISTDASGAMAILGWIVDYPVPPLGEKTEQQTPFILQLRYEQEGDTRFRSVTVAYPGNAVLAPLAVGTFSTQAVRVLSLESMRPVVPCRICRAVPHILMRVRTRSCSVATHRSFAGKQPVPRKHPQSRFALRAGADRALTHAGPSMLFSSPAPRAGSALSDTP